MTIPYDMGPDSFPSGKPFRNVFRRHVMTDSRSTLDDKTDDEQPTRLERHINAAEYWLSQADIYNFPDPARTECLQLAAIHASLAQALALTTPSWRPS